MAGVPTHVLRLRTDLEGQQELQLPRASAAADSCPLVIIVAGSPGMGHFYLPFASRLFEKCGGRYEVSVISHAGHSPGHYKDTGNGLLAGYHRAETESSADSSESGSSTVEGETVEGGTSASTVTDWYNLQDQIAHKVAFIEEELKNRESLVLVGHSIGCWMILQMLKRIDTAKVSRAFMLFPTIEKMGQTPNALSSTSYLWSSLRRPFMFLVWLSSKVVPEFVRKRIVDSHFSTTPVDHLDSISQGALNINERSIYNVLMMARQEMAEVVECPFDVIDEHIDKLVFYYGVGDRWNVEGSYSDMAARYPGKDVHLCERNIDHAFVEQSSDEMADFVHSKLFGH